MGEEGEKILFQPSSEGIERKNSTDLTKRSNPNAQARFSVLSTILVLLAVPALAPPLKGLCAAPRITPLAVYRNQIVGLAVSPRTRFDIYRKNLRNPPSPDSETGAPEKD